MVISVNYDHPTPGDAEEFEPEEGEVFARIRCSCGFEVVGADEYHNVVALEDHPCPNRPEPAPPRWWADVFSIWGFLMVLVIAYVVGAIFHAKGW